MNNIDEDNYLSALDLNLTTPPPIFTTTTTTTISPCEQSCLWEWRSNTGFREKDDGFWKLIVNPCPSQCPCYAPLGEGEHAWQTQTTLCGGSRPSGPVSPCNRYCIYKASDFLSPGFPYWSLQQNPCTEECPCLPPSQNPPEDAINGMLHFSRCGAIQTTGTSTTPIPLAGCVGAQCVWRSVRYNTTPFTYRWHLMTGCPGDPAYSSLCVCQPPNTNPLSEGLETTTSCSGPTSCSGSCTWKYNGSIWFVDFASGDCLDGCICTWPYPSNMPGQVGDTLPGVCSRQQTKPVLETCSKNCVFVWRTVNAVFPNQGYWEQLTACDNTCLGCNFPDYAGVKDQIAHTKCIPNTGTPNPGIPAEPPPLDCRGTCVYKYYGVAGYGEYKLDSENSTCNVFCASCQPVLSVPYGGETLTRTCLSQDNLLIPPKPGTGDCTGNCVYNWSDTSQKYILNDLETSCKDYSNCYPCWSVLNTLYNGAKVAVPCSQRPIYTTEPPSPPPDPFGACNDQGTCRYTWEPVSFWDNPLLYSQLYNQLGQAGYWKKVEDTCYSTSSLRRCFCPSFPNKYYDSSEELLLDCSTRLHFGPQSFDMSSVIMET